LIRDTIPQVAITTDVIVGFPGETDNEFEESYSFCRQAGFASIHVFPFSPRPGTPAADMPDQIGEKVKAERDHRLLELSHNLHREFSARLAGQVTPVLWEKETSPGSNIYSGLTDNYLRVFAPSGKPLSNEITPVKLTRLHSKGLWGEPLPGNSTSTGEVPSCRSPGAQGATSGWPLLSPQDSHIL
jgi:threonylcarbamoyladenosine tRNA methylthiotransferase MtaB